MNRFRKVLGFGVSLETVAMVNLFTLCVVCGVSLAIVIGDVIAGCLCPLLVVSHPYLNLETKPFSGQI